MRKSLHSEEKIISILKEHEAGTPIADLCRRHGMSQPTFYKYLNTTPAAPKAKDEAPKKRGRSRNKG